MARPFVRLLGAMMRPVYGGVGCVLCLHRVIPAEERSAFADNRALELSTAALREILEWVRERRLDPIPLDGLPDRLARPRGRKFIAFTLDDGYLDNLVHALPIFREFEMPLTVNVATGLVSGGAVAWWYALEDLLVARDRVTLHWQGEEVSFSCRNQPARDKAFEEIAKLIRGAGREERGDLLQALFFASETGALSRAKGLMMSWRDLRTLAADPLVTIGAHTVGHYSLNRLDDDEVRHEMAESKRELEVQLDREVRHFAYPFGGRNAAGPREFALARECGFATAVTTRSANLFPRHARHPMALPRIGVSGNYRPPLSRLRQAETGLLTAREQYGRRFVTE